MELAWTLPLVLLVVAVAALVSTRRRLARELTLMADGLERLDGARRELGIAVAELADAAGAPAQGPHRTQR